MSEERTLKPIKNMSFHMDSLLIQQKKGIPRLKSSFNRLDEKVGGGLPPGLIIIGATPGAGKTTLALQIADSVARAKKRVVFFSLEMARIDLFSKSISRICGERFIKAHRENQIQQGEQVTNIKETFADVSSDGIYSSNLDNVPSHGELLNISGLDERKRFYIDQSVEDYRDNIAPYLTIIEAGSDETNDYILETDRNGNFLDSGFSTGTLDNILREIQKIHKDAYEESVLPPPSQLLQPPIDQDSKPFDLVIVDYLQIVDACGGISLSDKQRVDRTVKELKRLALKYQVPFIVISSLNRDSYYEEISYKSFKESGGVEYSADILIGLQVNVKRDQGKAKPEDIDSVLSKNVRTLEAVILKNRYGRPKQKIKFDFISHFSYFVENKEDSTNKKLK